jgi:prepilin-type N-terminal cleavage/methylation domain-containing protein
MSRRPPHSSRLSAFTLVELMAVIAIIALLIGILIPAVGSAQKAAKVSHIQNTIRVLDTGLETYKADPGVGGKYPPSQYMAKPAADSPHAGEFSTGMLSFGGASMLVWALAGADLLGTPGFRDLDGDGYWRDDLSSNDGLYALSGSQQPVHARSGPFVAMEKMQLPHFSTTNGTPGYYIERYKTQSKPLYSHVFLDVYERPFLYYKANPGKPLIADNNAINPSVNQGIYNQLDNASITGAAGGLITEPGMQLGHPAPHPMRELGDPSGPEGSFARVVHDPDVTATARPYRPDSYLLLSAGPDGRYGTDDDVGNFPIKK